MKWISSGSRGSKSVSDRTSEATIGIAEKRRKPASVGRVEDALEQLDLGIELSVQVEARRGPQLGAEVLVRRVRFQEVGHECLVAGVVRVGEHQGRDVPVDLERREPLVEALEEGGSLALALRP